MLLVTYNRYTQIHSDEKPLKPFVSSIKTATFLDKKAVQTKIIKK